MTAKLFKNVIIWGSTLWLIGYVLGIILFLLVPATLIGWIITPFGILITIWVLLKKVKAETVGNYVLVGIIWTLIALLGDYLFIIKLLKPEDGYYKLDVYLYYAITFILPIIVGSKKVTQSNSRNSI